VRGIIRIGVPDWLSYSQTGSEPNGREAGPGHKANGQDRSPSVASPARFRFAWSSICAAVPTQPKRAPGDAGRRRGGRARNHHAHEGMERDGAGVSTHVIEQPSSELMATQKTRKPRPTTRKMS